MVLTATWESAELPVLEMIISLVESEPPGIAISLDDVLQVMEYDEDVVARAIQRLSHEHLVTQRIDALGSPSDFIIWDVTPKGLRAAGVWPSEDAAAEAFIKALNQQIEEAPEGSSKKTALEKIKASAQSVGEGTLTAVVSAAVKGAAGF